MKINRHVIIFKEVFEKDCMKSVEELLNRVCRISKDQESIRNMGLSKETYNMVMDELENEKVVAKECIRIIVNRM